ncbi:uncharacterized protein LOC126835134 [Adelges cooleyi]|uniref:uncharacterized protein LOC126835134 n=1 Tax=Adelges cooleyi TaxID=133065 RepID=UPI002180193F|nr:uncharacterized protein LOC126835134 [Adelges cooleyi]
MKSFFLCVVAFACGVFGDWNRVKRASYMYPEMVHSNDMDDDDEHHQVQCTDCKMVAKLQTVDEFIDSTVKLHSRMPIVKIRSHRNTATDPFDRNIVTKKMKMSKPRFSKRPLTTETEWLNVPVATDDTMSAANGGFDFKWNNLIKTTTNNGPNIR